MSIETDFRASMLAHGPLVSLVGSGVALNVAPNDQPVPFVVYSTTHDLTYALDGSLADDTASISAQCWAATAAGAQAVAEAVVGAVNAASTLYYAATLASETVFDPTTQFDGVELTITWTAVLV